LIGRQSTLVPEPERINPLIVIIVRFPAGSDGSDEWLSLVTDFGRRPAPRRARLPAEEAGP
jgi:hypothetical protein